MRLHELKEVLLVELLHDDDRPAEADRPGDPDPGRRVIERRRGEIGLALAEFPELVEHGEDRQRLRRRLEWQRPQDPFGLPGRSGGVEHPRAERLVGDRRCGKASGRFVQVEHAVAVAGSVNDQAEFDIGQRHRRERDVALRLRRDQRPGEAVVDDIGDFARGQERIDVGVIEARSLARCAALDEADVVLHEDGIVIKALEADIAQEMRQPVAARLELAIGDRFARSRHDDGRLIGTRYGVQAWVHSLPPGREGSGLVAVRPAFAGTSQLASGLARCRGEWVR